MVSASSRASLSGIGQFARIAHAVASNQLARFAPTAYVRLTGQTGRGAAEEEGAGDIATYFRRCMSDYVARLAQTGVDGDFLTGKVLMEYGPGDLPGVAMLMVAQGAEKVYCVDRFPLLKMSEKNGRVVDALVDDRIAGQRVRACLRDPGNPQAGFDERRVEYLVKPSGLSGLIDAVDLVYSRAVLEHVNDLEATFADMLRAMRPGALAIHQVDLRSHGLHRHNPLDFLTWSPALWNWMYSEKGVPNRWRVDRYRCILERLPVEVQQLQSTALASGADVATVRPMLASPFRAISDEDLRWLGFWLVFRKRSK